MRCAVLAALAALPCAAEVAFNRDIRPIMADTCFRCHGPDKQARMANLRLDIREEALKPLRPGVVPIVPGEPARSAIVERVMARDARVMPPQFAHKDLTAAQKDLIRQWVAEGARYEGHWAYQPLRKPPVPDGAPHPIDAFVRARLAAEGRKPSPEADRRTLARRAALDLTGLPPAPRDLDEYLKTGDYDKLVDRLLLSPRYAEKRAMLWLDAVRYADTRGFHGDNPVPVWPYRDYVLRAFRDNKPFDQFTREQLAGDLLPNATVEQKVASAFNRLSRTSAEGGLQPKEYLAKYAGDRVRTLSAVWLGSTLGCAECHDHKFDPFLARDFYAMEAFFADIAETGLVPDQGPKSLAWQLALPTADQSRRLEELREKLGDRKAPAPAKLAWKNQRPVSASAANGAVLTIYNDRLVDSAIYVGGAHSTERAPGDGLVIASGPNPDNETYTIAFQPGAGVWTALGVDVVLDESLPGVRMARGADRLVISEVEAESSGRRLPFSYALSSAGVPSPEHPAMAAIDGDPKTGWGVPTYGDGRSIMLVLRFSESLATDVESAITVRLRQDSMYRRATLGRFRLALSATGFPMDASHIEAARLEAEAGMLEAGIAKVVVTEAGEPRETRVLPRGNFLDESGPIVEPAVPSFLGGLETAGRRASRLDLADWLVSPRNPLTARVTVNRVWREFFGAGLSKSLDDLGSQGDWPTHAALLDWLAADFRSDWDVRRLIRTIVTSATYRQASSSDERDPDNRLLARQSRFRVDAETVRDIALEVSGLLVEKFGGPSVKPYQPEGYLAALNFPKREYSASHGEDLYRRGLYTFWQRTFLHPSLMTFDAPSREECTVNRASSNTPLQALVTLNDPVYVEAARVFAAHAVRRGGIEWAFERALGRKAQAEERRTLLALYRRSLSRFRANPTAALELIRTGEAPAANGKPADLAAMTVVTRAILNLHETITRN